MENDPIFVGEGDIDSAREIVENIDDSEFTNISRNNKLTRKTRRNPPQILHYATQ